MKAKAEYSKQEYFDEVIKLWEDVVRTVYLKEPEGYSEEIAERGWDGINMTPLKYVIWTADPTNLTNMTNRGQKAREKRFKEWRKKHENPRT